MHCDTGSTLDIQQNASEKQIQSNKRLFLTRYFVFSLSNKKGNPWPNILLIFAGNGSVFPHLPQGNLPTPSP